MSIDVKKESLKDEGQSLLYQLRDTIKQFKDIFRLNYNDLCFKSI